MKKEGNRFWKTKIEEKNQNDGRAVFKGDSCEYVDLSKIISLDGCETGKDD